MKLGKDFYTSNQVVDISRALIGKYLFSRINGELTGGIIVETEAYEGVIDKASHAYGNRLTERTQVMYEQGGRAYVYLCYGIHHLFNVVTNVKGIPHAVLIRAIEPVEGLNIMLERRGKEKIDYSLTSGPGTLSKALGITSSLSGTSLTGSSLWIEDRGVRVPHHQVIASPRVGVAYAAEHALLRYRFRLKDSLWTSKAK